MTWGNSFKINNNIRLWYLVILLWNGIKTNVCFADGKCPKGTFKSDYLSGGCVLCPRKLKYCENEEVDDSIRCFKACRKIFSTPQPKRMLATPTTDFRKSSVSPQSTTLTTKATEKSTQGNYVSTAYTNFKTTLAVTSTPYSTSGRSRKSNTTDIIVGITMSIAALLLVVVVLFKICWTGRSANSTIQQPGVKYGAAPTSSTSNSDENLEPEGPPVTEGHAVGENMECSLPTLSRERLNEMPETHL